ncbi:MAG: hypothetical protein JW876_12440 [Candidatus Krumholzibacteriota bacterium]|nr:hypothetical protein [Candidatus Krumholzibacteriota bacterium]
MNTRTIVRILLVLLVLASGVYLLVERRGTGGIVATGGGPGPGDQAAGPFAGPDRVIVFYFHGDKRCPTCMKLERYTRESVAERFADGIAGETVEFRSVNVDEPGNDRFVTDYELTTKAVILVETAGGRQARWRNLDRIWDLVGNETVFKAYIAEETERFIGGDDG